MVFSSQTFLFFFLPLAGLCVLIRSKPVQNAMLLIASLIFYAWGEPKMVVLMVLVTLVAYGSGFAIVHFEARPRAKKAALIAAIVVILGNLVVFKYLNFLFRTFSFLGLTDPGIALPIGISFYTFQILSYVIDLYRGKIALQRNFFYLLMYVSFFPQLIAGPIVRYETVEQEIRERQVTMDDLAQGFRRFVVGLAKKLLLANQVAQVATIVYSGTPANYGSLMYWLAAIAYTLQIYFDFSGYSDMAIGLGRMFGFHFLENFNYPYISLSVTEFWRRWHISLSTWFRDYVYIPLGGNRVSRGKWVRNILVVWGLTGLWHGADWNFLLWGLYYGVLLLIEKLWLGKYLERLPKALRWLLCMIIVCIGWVMFNLTDFAQMRCALARMFSFTHVALSQSLAADVSIVPPLLWMLPALVFSTPVCRRVHLGESCGAEIVPVDSEHSAIFQCLTGREGELHKILLTGSGGPFRGWTREQTRDVTPEMAVRHPNWSMGNKITIDSATLMNKGLEFIEAKWLFDLTPEQIEIVVHRQSVVHSAVEYQDCSVIAQMGVPDMKIPIQYALLYPERLPCPTKHLSLTDYGTLTFEKPDMETFSCLKTAIAAITTGGTAPCIVNGANEVAVAAFLSGKIRFLDIGALAQKAMEMIPATKIETYEDVMRADTKAREFVRNTIA